MALTPTQRKHLEAGLLEERTRVAELVQDHAGEQGKDETDTGERRRAAARNPVCDPDPCEEQEKRGVYI